MITAQLEKEKTVKRKVKTPMRSNRVPLSAPTEKWRAIDTALDLFEAEAAPLLQPLSEAERQALLGVGTMNESFTRDVYAGLKANPGIAAPILHPEDALRDWTIREELAARRMRILGLVQRIEDTMAGLESDCYVVALAIYEGLRRSGTPAGLGPLVEKTKANFAARAVKARKTRALKGGVGPKLAPVPPTTPAAGPEAKSVAEPAKADSVAAEAPKAERNGGPAVALAS